jgi:hypothetical protein
VCGATAFLNCLIYYQPELVPQLLQLQVLPIALVLLSVPSKQPPQGLRELVRLVQALSCGEEAATLIAAQKDSASVLLSLFVFLSDDDDAIATCEILENVWQSRTVAPPRDAQGERVEGQDGQQGEERDMIVAGLPHLAGRRQHHGTDGGDRVEGGDACDAETCTSLSEVLERGLLLLHPLARHLATPGSEGQGQQEEGGVDLDNSAVWWLVVHVIELGVLPVLTRAQRERVLTQAQPEQQGPAGQRAPVCGSGCQQGQHSLDHGHSDPVALADGPACVDLLLVHLVSLALRVPVGRALLSSVPCVRVAKACARGDQELVALIVARACATDCCPGYACVRGGRQPRGTARTRGAGRPGCARAGAFKEGSRSSHPLLSNHAAAAG